MAAPRSDDLPAGGEPFGVWFFKGCGGRQWLSWRVAAPYSRKTLLGAACLRGFKVRVSLLLLGSSRQTGSGEWRESQEEENLDSWSLFCEQRGEVARGEDARGLVTGERQQAAFVAGDKVIRFAGLRQGQQEVIAGVG